MNRLLEDYAAGPDQLRAAVNGMTDDQLDARPMPDRWTSRQVICHIADCEIVYADRMKRVIVESSPALKNLDPDEFAGGLAYRQRDVGEELHVVQAIRSQMDRILRTLDPACFQRTGEHSTDGTLTLEDLLNRIAGHIPHHIRFLEEKRAALARTG